MESFWDMHGSLLRLPPKSIRSIEVWYDQHWNTWPYLWQTSVQSHCFIICIMTAVHRKQYRPSLYHTFAKSRLCVWMFLLWVYHYQWFMLKRQYFHSSTSVDNQSSDKAFVAFFVLAEAFGWFLVVGVVGILYYVFIVSGKDNDTCGNFHHLKTTDMYYWF